MTKEEAIARLEANRGAFVFKETNEALDMAIEALQTNTEGDLISRQDAIGAICKTSCEITPQRCAELTNNRYCLLRKSLKELPSAEPKTGECETCKRNADNGGFYDDGRTRCPIQEHYALLKDGYCHLYEPRMRGDEE